MEDDDKVGTDDDEAEVQVEDEKFGTTMEYKL